MEIVAVKEWLADMRKLFDAVDELEGAGESIWEAVIESVEDCDGDVEELPVAKVGEAEREGVEERLGATE